MRREEDEDWGAFGNEDLGYDARAATHVSWRRALGLFRPYGGRLIVILGLILASSLAGVAAPFLLRGIIDTAFPAGDLGLLALLAGGLIALSGAGTVIGALQGL
ncbi:ABC transporter ATP-binding protein [Roseospira marina]|uniref:ABC transporter ATP-binding protein n=1 Tax=Roseospira marina TaxID=140057 RepID=A0A5M6I7N4_9PROT|nr:ABC transporter ATP-binding protein [Roseospira marina]KAA5604241.1 ABC transporter ATP-binding protein [Roseospira marina]MBB4315613.1 ABC-type bacteriocin/lantibiotic exporter with double-glycine peptidase domain [Roseospira marina]MBB5088609.1 ABC-type bacteriocin/lantibiotic exporter with double-glycine peptidase domain [Roseospira marina]